MFSTFMIGGTWRRNRFRISGFLTSCHLLREVLEHLDGLLEAAELPGAHGEPPPDVDHYVRVPPGQVQVQVQVQGQGHLCCDSMRAFWCWSCWLLL